jgi:hypothetical protein
VSYGESFAESDTPLKLTLAIPSVNVAITNVPSGQEEQTDTDFSVEVLDHVTSHDMTPALPSPSVERPSGRDAAHRVHTDVGAANGVMPLLKAPPRVQTVVYLLDRSLSMGVHGALNRARREILTSVASLPRGARFQVIVYNREPQSLQVNAQSGYLAADETTRQQLAVELDKIAAAGTTDHGRALRVALQLRPDVIFLVTDADDLSDVEVRNVTRLNNGQACINTVELSRNRRSADGPLQRLASSNGGAFQHASPVERTND